MSEHVLSRSRRISGLPSSRGYRSGAALIVMVLLSAVAASIALVLVHSTLSSGRNASDVGAVRAAGLDVSNARSAFEQALAGDPRFFYARVWSDPADSASEAARVCLAGPQANTTIAPGQAWPASCGDTWTYAAPSPRPLVEAEIVPPGAMQASLTVRFSATVASAAAGQSVTYRYGDSGRFGVYSSADLPLDSLGTATLSGMVYSGGHITMPTSSSVTLSGATLAAEGGFVGTTTGVSGASFYEANPPKGTNGQPVMGDIRSIVPSPAQSSALASAAAHLKAVACGPPPAALPARTDPAGPLSTSLCLTRGGQVLPDNSTATVTVPADTAAYLLAFGRTPTSTGVGVGTLNQTTVDVFTSASPDTTTAGSCAMRCSPTALAAPSVSDLTSPGVLPPSGTTSGHWRFLGTFDLPASGVVATDYETDIGSCGAAFDTTGSCQTVTAQTPGATGILTSITVVAGTTASPADVYFDGPVVTDGGTLGVVATGDVVIPYWSHPEEGALTIDASIAMLGLGHGSDTSASSLTTYPAEMHPRASATDPDWAASITFNGTLSASALGLNLPGYVAVNLAGPPAGAPAAPWMAGFTDAFAVTSVAPMSPSQLAAMP